LSLQRADGRGTHAHQQLRLQRDQLLCHHGGSLSAGRRVAVLDFNVASFRPAEAREPLTGSRNALLHRRIAFGSPPPHAAPPRRLLCARRERPRGRRAAEQRDELAPSHSITSSARASNVVGTSRPSALAVFRLITNSYLVGACTGRSAGFSPLRMRST